jgi:hypothetical protein
MGTRGFVGFIIDGTEKITYNHWDSYPTGLGAQVVEAILSEHVTPDAVRELTMITDKVPPTPEEQRKLARWADTGVDDGKLSNWYVLLRQTQGDIVAMLKAGYAEDASYFPLDSLFAEWGYILDMDTMTLEVYQGFQHSPHTAGRFASRTVTDEYARDNGYYPCALIAVYPMLGGLPDATELARLESSDEG